MRKSTKRYRQVRRDLRIERLESEFSGQHRSMETLEQRLLLSSVIISEFMASNNSTLQDADGDFSDWIELQNTSLNAVNLENWSLTDDGDDLTKWTFPSTILPAGDHLVIFASGKDGNIGGQLHTNFQLDADGEYLALVEPDGSTLATVFDPFPDQFEDISYGTEQAATSVTAVDEGATADILIPTDGSLGTTWTGGNEPFNTAGWTTGATGVGFDANGGGPITSDAPNLVAYYDFDDVDDPTVALDTSPAVVADGFINGPTYQLSPSPVGGTAALRFNGGGNRVTVNSFKRPDDTYTYSLWFNPTNNLTSGSPRADLLYGLQQGGETSPRPHLSFNKNGGGEIGLFTNDNGSNSGEIVTATNSWNANTWYHIAFTFDGIIHRVFVDGELDNTRVAPATQPSDTGFNIGANSGGGNAFIGLIDEVAIFDDALNFTLAGSTVVDGEMHALYNQGVNSAASPTSHFATLDFGQFGQRVEPGAVAINGAGSGFAVTNVPVTADTGDQITVSTSIVDFRDRGDSASSDPLVQLGEDFIKQNGGTVTVTLGDMPAGKYAVTGYHTDSDFDQASIIRVFVTDANGANVLQSGTGNAGTLLTGVNDLSTAEMNRGRTQFIVESDGVSPIVIRFDGTTSPDTETPLNGLRIEQFAGPSLEAFIDTDIQAQMFNTSSSAYLRFPFNITNPGDFDTLTLNMKYDDAFVAYINGVEVARSSNAPAGAVDFDSTATSERDQVLAGEFQGFNITQHLGALQAGDNILAIHGINRAIDNEDFLIEPQLIGSNIEGTALRFFDTPTPDATNNDGFLGFVGDTEFSIDRGFYDAPINVEITSDTPGAQIYYTTNGSDPSPTNGTLYTGPINITTTTTLRAVATKTDFQSSNIDTQTYIFIDDVLNQPLLVPGLPSTWRDGGGSKPADYGIDPDITGSPVYGDLVDDALLAIPTLSIVTDQASFWDFNTGIYMNSRSKGIAWERATSAELIFPDGSEGFQIDAGLRMQGGASRAPEASPKHSMSLRFRQIYGEGDLDFPLFPGTEVDDFDTIHLRAMYNNSWIHRTASQRNAAQMIRDQWARQTMIDMGNEDGGHGRPAHIYLNGLYWGIYMLQERPDENHYAAYAGVDGDVIDALNGGSFINGSSAAWNEMKAAVSSRDWNLIQERLDVENYIDFILVQRFGGNDDLKGNGNWRAAGGGPDRLPFKFYAWDTERILEGNDRTTQPRPEPDPPGIWNDLIQIPDFQILLADRIQKHLFNGGALTVDANIARYQAIASELELPMIAESARWGDYRRDVFGNGTKLYTQADWLNERNRIINSYFPFRTNFVINEFQNINWSPDIDAPTFNQNGGPITPGFQLTMTNPNALGTLYYTTDGSDPRLPTVGEVDTTTLVAESDTKRVIVPNLALHNQIGTTWRGGVAFDDSGWTQQIDGVGYDQNTTYNPFLDLSNDLEPLMVGTGKNTSAYIRVAFNVTADQIAKADTMTLKMRWEDAFVAFINGTEVTRSPNVPGSLTWNSAATGTNSDSAAVTQQSFDLTVHLDELQVGQNILAIHGINRSLTSSDFLISPQLDITDVPEGSTGVSPSAIEYTGPITLDDNTHIRARILSGTTWSAANVTTFSLTDQPLRITELMYNAADPTPEELLVIPALTSDDLEWLEVRNTSTSPLNIAGFRFTVGIDYTFPSDTILAPGEHLILSKNVAAFELRYGTGHNVIGPYTSNISDNGEQLVLVDSSDNVIHDFEYDDDGPWPGRADGTGSSLEVIDTEGDYSDPDNWRSSSEYLGSPGVAGAGTRHDVVVNEVLTHTDLPQIDAIELHNRTGASIDISGWVLSDSNSRFDKFVIPANTIIPANGYLVFDENDFNAGLSNVDFALDSANGEDVWLLETDAQGDLISFVDHVEFGAAANGEAWGRVPNGTGILHPVVTPTLGGPNAAPRIGPLIISEIMYNPPAPTQAELDTFSPDLDDEDFEYVEIYNPTGSTVDLENWRLRKGVDFNFDPGTTLGPGEVAVVIRFNPLNPENADRLDAFRARYGIDTSVTLLGGYSGRLDNGGEKVELRRPDDPTADVPPIIPYLLEDRAVYDDVAPWPTDADGLGDSLHRLATTSFGSNASSWIASIPTPGSVVFNTNPQVNVHLVPRINASPTDLVPALPAPDTDPNTGGGGANFWQREGSDFTIEVWVKSDQVVAAIDTGAIQVKYDPAFAEALGVDHGTIFNQGGTTFDNIDPITGTVEFGGDASVSNAGDDEFALLGRVVFRAKAPIDPANLVFGPFDADISTSAAANAFQLSGIGVVPHDLQSAPDVHTRAVIYDFDNNGVVNFADLGMLLPAIGEVPGGSQPPFADWADFDNNETVDTIDRDLLLAAFGLAFDSPLLNIPTSAESESNGGPGSVDDIDMLAEAEAI